MSLMCQIKLTIANCHSLSNIYKIIKSQTNVQSNMSHIFNFQNRENKMAALSAMPCKRMKEMKWILNYEHLTVWKEKKTGKLRFKCSWSHLQFWFNMWIGGMIRRSCCGLLNAWTIDQHEFVTTSWENFYLW